MTRKKQPQVGSSESRMLSQVRQWRKDAFEARERGQAKDNELLRSFGIKVAPAKRRKPLA